MAAVSGRLWMKRLVGTLVCEVAGAAITGSHGLSSFKSRDLFSHTPEARRSRPRSQQDWFLLRPLVQGADGCLRAVSSRGHPMVCLSVSYSPLLRVHSNHPILTKLDFTGPVSKIEYF